MRPTIDGPTDAGSRSASAGLRFRRDRRVGPVEAIVLIALLLVFFLNGLNDAIQNSAVADEVGGHLDSGYLYWTSGKYSGGIGNFPLAHLLTAFPAAVLGYSRELFTEDHLLLFRLPVLVLGVLAGIVLHRFTSGLFGGRAALAAVFLFALSPNILTHASLATLDFPITFFVLLTIYTLWCYVHNPHWARTLAVSLALACALTTKIQALLLIPIVLTVVLVHGLRRRSKRAGEPLPFWSWVFLPLVPWLFIHLVYLHPPLADGRLLPHLFVRALKIKMFHASGQLPMGQDTYLCGRYSAEGWWYYFPFAILVKTPVPTLILLALGAVQKHRWETWVFVILPIAAFLGAAMTASLNIGLRHVLVIYPFLFMLAGSGAARLWVRSWRGALLALLAAWYVVQAALVAPHHLSYFNAAAGGPKNGHRLLIGSNYDSGQNDRFLERYIEDRGASYRINPDPFHPMTGHILVKVNAFYGRYGCGGPTAYWWLKGFEPVNQIAYTWFEYDIPERGASGVLGAPRGVRSNFRPWNVDIDAEERDAALEEIELDLVALQERHRDVLDPEFHLRLASALAAAASYENALDEIRWVLDHHPDHEGALGLGGEIMVGWKVGSLRFEGDEYLAGFEMRRMQPGETPPDLETVARLARFTGITGVISNAHYRLGIALEAQGKIREAAEEYYATLTIRPSHPEARQRLRRARAVAESGSGAPPPMTDP